MKLKDILGILVGLVMVCLAFYLLSKELSDVSLDNILKSLKNFKMHHWFLMILSTLGSYCALAWYDRIALQYLNEQKNISWMFAALCSFTTYALSHNIGASVISGAAVRYKAYSSKGLSFQNIAKLVVLCAFTFVLGIIFLTGLVLIIEPDLLYKLPYIQNISYLIIRFIGFWILMLICLYIYGSYKSFKPFKIGKVTIEYPKFNIAIQQLIAGPLEICCAAGIIYFALPDGCPNYWIVLGVFLLSFSLSLISNAPGGLGVLEYSFILFMQDVNKSDIIVALMAFRILYLILPLFISVFIIIGFEILNVKNQQYL